MKKLICGKDIEILQKSGQKVLYVDACTIVTPSAKYMAKSAGIEITCGTGTCTAAPAAVANPAAGIDSNTIYTVLKALMDKGMLQGVFDSIQDKPYQSETDPCGLKLVRGNSVKYEVLDTGNTEDKVFYQEIINSGDGSSMNAGFITIEKCNFDWDVACEELYHVVEGTLTVGVNGTVYTANPGDSLFFPKGAKVTFGSPNRMKAFYATY